MGIILLVTDCARGPECAAALQRSTGERVEIIKSVRRCAHVMHEDKLPVSSLIAVVVDSALIESESAAAEELLERADTALPIIINLAISGIDRVARDVKLALQRYSKQRLMAMQAAESILRSQVKSAVTGILRARLEPPGAGDPRPKRKENPPRGERRSAAHAYGGFSTPR